MGSLQRVYHRQTQDIHNWNCQQRISLSLCVLRCLLYQDMADTMVELPPPAPAPAAAPKGGEYPTGSISAADEELMGELTLDELKMAFRLFDDEGEGFIRVLTFRGILKEIDEEFSDEELDGIINEIDSDGSGTIDFDEFCKIMT